jgi:Pyruvate/2-oxoacid:ferredoxin oxidoreductase delta subunit
LGGGQQGRKDKGDAKRSPSTQPPERLAQAAALLGAPAFVVPWLERFVEPVELSFVLELGGEQVSVGRAAEVAARLWRGPAEPALERLHRRGLLDLLDEQGCPVSEAERPVAARLADFHDRLEVWALFEESKDFPAEVRAALHAWELEDYESRKVRQIEALKQGREPDPGLENAEYLLLAEAEAVIDQVQKVYLWPCNCRGIAGLCDKPVLTCLRFDNERGLGREISKERAKEVLREASRAGLMHTGELARAGGDVTGAICNCCSDCCYPHLVATRQQAERLWPRTRYLARHLPDRCSACGRCVRRCPFGAFRPGESSADAEQEQRPKRPVPQFQQDVCRGCGVCWVACPEEAIQMERWEPEDGQEPREDEEARRA